MDKKEADMIVIEVGEQECGNETGQFEEEQPYCSSDQKTEAGLGESESTNDIKAKGETKRLSEQLENLPIAFGSKNKEPDNEIENENENKNKNKGNHPNVSGSSLQNDKIDHQKHKSRNEYPNNKLISKIKESEGKERQQRRTPSFIRPTNAPCFKQSLKYSVEAVMWIFYHSIALATVPTIIIIIMYGSLWFIHINNENMTIYFASTEAFYNICLYAAISGLSIHIFGKERAFNLVYKLAIPFCMIHIGFSALSIFFKISLLWVGCYGTFLSFNYLMMKNISTKIQNQANDAQISNRYDVLASDGTPLAIIKGFVSFFVIYVLSISYIVPYCMEAGIFIRIIGRILVLPILFSISDSYMNSQIMDKSVEYLKYRMIPGNVASVMFLSILRFMISYSSSTYDTFVMSLSSGVFEVILWSCHIPRSIYTMKITGYLKSILYFSLCGSKQIKNFNDIYPQSNANETNEAQPNHDEIAKVENLEPTIAGFKKIFSQFNQEDTTTRSVISHRTYRSVILSMSEFQFIIFLPIILYLCKPINHYLTYQPTSSIAQFFASVCIQLPIEFLTQIASLCLENYLYGIQVPVEKSLKYNLKPLVMLQYALISLFVMHQSTFAFWIPPEHWSNS